jgi:hypothetical protein
MLREAQGTAERLDERLVPGNGCVKSAQRVGEPIFNVLSRAASWLPPHMIMNMQCADSNVM